MRETDPNPTIAHLFYKICNQYPENVAVIHGDLKKTFKQLRNDANRIAWVILDHTRGESVPVVIFGDSTYESICAITAVCLTGAYFAFLDYEHSPEQNRKIVQQLKPQLVLTTRDFLPTVEEMCDKTARIVILNGFVSDDLHGDITHEFSYQRPLMIPYTSGSTGEPKGLVMLYQNIINRHLDAIAKVGSTPQDVQSATMSFSFSWGIPAVFYMLITGCAISIFRYGQRSPLEIVEWIQRDHLSIIQMPSTYFHQFILALSAYPEIDLPSVRLINTGGEKLRVESLRLWQSHPKLDFIVRDSMSSTETATYLTASFTKKSPIPEEIIFDELGTNSEVFIRSGDGNLEKRDAEGEIAVYTSSLFHEYFHNPEKTRQRFITHPTDPSKRLFLTGDMGSLDEFGRLVLHGRSDHMVKIRGYRVDLEEIRAEIKKLPEIKDAAVIKTPGKRGEDLLAAFVLYHPEMKISVSELKQKLHKTLNPYKVPAIFTRVDSLPYSTAGKIQLSRLPSINRQRPELNSRFVQPSGELEKTIVEIWQEVLDLADIGVEDDFFELGGDSISAVEIMSQIRQRFEKEVSMSFFERPTISTLARIISNEGDDNSKHINQSKHSRSVYMRKKQQILNPRFWLTRYFSGMPYPLALETIQKLSTNFIFRELVYAHQKGWFNRWLDVLEYQTDPAAAFSRFIIADLTHSFGWIKNYDPLPRVGNGQPPTSNQTVFVRSLLEKLKTVTKEEDLDWIPINGFHHFRSAIEDGNGVILLSLHSNVRFDLSPIIEKLAGIPPMITVSFNLGKFGKYGKDPSKAGYFDLVASNAEVAADALNHLRAGRVLQIFSDTQDSRTKNYTADLLGKPRNFKAGFAELAVKTGAAIIPTYNYIDDQNRVSRAFLPPLHSDQSSYDGKILDMVEQYARFIESSWKNHPEIQTVSKIKKFFRNGMNWQ